MEGKIFYQGEVLDETRLAGLRGNGISLIPQGVSYLDPLMRVGDQICGGRKDEATRAKCRQLLSGTGWMNQWKNVIHLSCRAAWRGAS